MKSIILIVILLVSSILLSCTSKVMPVEKPSTTQTKLIESKIAEKAVWEVKWESTLQEARKEGVVVVYASSVGPALKEAMPVFNKKFGFVLESYALDRGAALTARLFSERRAGLYIPDVLLTGMNNFINETRPAGAVDPLEPALILPEVLDSKVWYGGQIPWGDKEHLVIMANASPNTNIAINTDLVNLEEIKSYYDLLKPKWKGKIIMNDPSVTGTGLKTFSVLAFHTLNLDFFRQLARQEPMIIRDQRLQVDWLARGKFSILLFPRPAPVMEFKRAGAPVAYIPTPVEGTHLSRGGGNISLANRAPHPNAARIFINWFLSREGQTLIPGIEGIQSSRDDIPTDALDPLRVRKPGGKYFTGADGEEWLSRDPEFTQAAIEIFGHLIK